MTSIGSRRTAEQTAAQTRAEQTIARTRAERKAMMEMQESDGRIREKDPVTIIREILSRVEGAEIRQKHGSRFHFPFYLTKTMAETSIESLELSVRSYNSLKRAGYSTVGELAEAVAGEENVLVRIRNCGKKSASEIMARLFAWQYEQMKPDRQEKYLQEVIRLNCGECG